MGTSGRPQGARNKPVTAMPLDRALEVLSASATQSVPVTAEILGTTEDAIYREVRAERLQAIRLGRLWRVPSAVIRKMIEPPAAVA